MPAFEMDDVPPTKPRNVGAQNSVAAKPQVNPSLNADWEPDLGAQRDEQYSAAMKPFDVMDRTEKAPQGNGSFEVSDNVDEEPGLNDPKTVAVAPRLNDMHFQEPGPKDSNYIREELPSHFVFYDFKSLHIRKFKPSDASLIYRGMTEGKFSLIIDAIDNTINVDARKLTVGDFFYLMYWQRINSYPRKPLTIEWTSRYGNENKFTVNNTSITIKSLEISTDKLKTYFDMGLTVPLVRDMEFLQVEELTPDEKWLYERAQYVKGDSLREKITNLDALSEDMSSLSDIADFRELIEHGVIERVMVRDQKFDPEKAIEVLNIQASELRNAVRNNELDNAIAAQLISKAIEFEAEAREIEVAFKNKIEYLPKEEEIAISMNAMRFFPGI